MEIITKRQVIQGVQERWNRQYSRMRSNHPLINVGPQLESLNLDIVSADDVNKIIGNNSWTALSCDECKKDVEAIIVVGEEPDYESSTARVCFDCIRKAAAMTYES